MQKYKLLKAYDAGGDINKEWFVYYHYLKPKEFQRPNEPLYERFKVGKTINCIHTVKERKQQLKVVYLAVKNMLEEGFNPFAEYRVQDHVEYAGYNICSCIDKYLASIDGDLKPHTIRIYKNRLGYLKLWLESKGYDNLLIFDVTKQHIFEFLKHRQITAKLSNKTFNHYLQAISTFFQYYIDNYDDYLKENPCNKIKRLQATKNGNRPMDNYDFPRILEHVKKKDPFLFQFCRFIYYTCMRPNAELRFLRINEIDLRARRLMVPGQNAKSKVTQVIPIDEAFASILEEMNLDQYPRDYYVFGKEYKPGPEPIHDRYFTKLFRKVKDELNLDTAITLYAFKHTRVIHLVEDGEKLHNIIQLTRHKTLAELMDYLKDMGVIIGDAVKLKSRSI